MTISDIGWCPQCTRNVLDHPALVCPWCSSAAGTLAKKELELPAGAGPGEIIHATTTYIAECMARIKSAQAVRTGAARQALAGDLPAIAAEAHVRVRSIEKWAKVEEAQCAAGHARADHGKLVKGRWKCLECERLKPAPQPRVFPKGRTKVRDAWRSHEQRMERRQILAKAGQLPDHLNPPMEPPVPMRKPT